MKVSTLSVASKKRASVVETIPIANISNKFDVREALDDDRVLYLAELYENGVEIDPIKVIKIGQNKVDDDIYAFVDGRHRAAARALLNLPQIDAYVVENDDADMVDLYAESLRANYGGAKPPTREDIRHTIQRMLETGAKSNRIREALDFIPLSFLRKYISDAQSRIHKHRLSQALVAIANGAKLAEAAEQYGVDLETLKAAVTGQRKKAGRAGSAALEFKSYVTKALRTANFGIAGKIKFLLQQIEEGEVPVKVGEEVIEAWEAHLDSSKHRIRDWRERLLAVADSVSGGGKN